MYGFLARKSASGSRFEWFVNGLRRQLHAQAMNVGADEAGLLQIRVVATFSKYVTRNV